MHKIDTNVDRWTKLITSNSLEHCVYPKHNKYPRKIYVKTQLQKHMFLKRSLILDKLDEIIHYVFFYCDKIDNRMLH